MRPWRACGVIVSASYRTDIPAFYARWFLRRLRFPFGHSVLGVAARD